MSPGSTNGVTMGWFKKAKKLADDHADTIEDGIDRAADLAKDKLGDEHDETVDSVAEKAKELLDDVDGD
ncbi:MAG: antitoxin [Acidimicrobiales bacterium]